MILKKSRLRLSLIFRREVSREEGIDLAGDEGLLFDEISAMSGDGVDRVLESLAEAIYEKVRTGEVDPLDYVIFQLF